MQAFRMLTGAAMLCAAVVLAAGPSLADAGAPPSCPGAASPAARPDGGLFAACPQSGAAARSVPRPAPNLAQRRVRCHRVCAQRVRECHTEQRCNYVTGKCRNVQVCTTRCDYYEDRPLGCDP